MTNKDQLDYLAGFFDAEGCVTMSSCRENLMMEFVVTQSSPGPLHLYREMFGGSVRMVRKSTETHREKWVWQKHCGRNDRFVEAMRDRLTVKAHAMECASSWVKLIGSAKDHPERRATQINLKRANAGEFDNEMVALHRKGAAYWAGMFDGDGMATAGKTTAAYRAIVTITSAYMPLLTLAQHQFGGRIYDSYIQNRVRVWKATGREAKEFLEIVEPLLSIRRAVSRKVSDLYEAVKSGKTLLLSGPRNGVWTYPATSLSQIDALAYEIRSLNRRGPGRKLMVA